MNLIQVRRASPGFHGLGTHHFYTLVLPTFIVTLHGTPHPALITNVPKQTSFHAVVEDLEQNTNPRVIDLGCHQSDQKQLSGASLLAQWLRICLPMQGTRVQTLVWEDPTCRGATGPVSHNY